MGGFNTQPPKGDWAARLAAATPDLPVSTHSRLKATGSRNSNKACSHFGFNTQPPKGDWILNLSRP